MDIYINKTAVNCERQYNKGIPVIHQKFLIGIFDCLGNNRAFYITAVYIIIHKTTVASGKIGGTDISA